MIAFKLATQAIQQSKESNTMVQKKIEKSQEETKRLVVEINEKHGRVQERHGNMLRDIAEDLANLRQSLLNPNSPNESVTPISDPQGSGDGHGRSAYPGDPRQPTNGSSLPKASPATDHTWANRHGSFEDPFQA